MNFAIIEHERWYRHLVCTCGYTERSCYHNNCPKCHTPVFKYIRQFQNYTRYSFVEKEINDEKAYFKNTIIDLSNNELGKFKCPEPVNQNIYETNIDFRKHNVEIKVNGSVVNATFEICKRAMTGIDKYDLGDFLYKLGRLIDGTTSGPVLYYFLKHPQVEVLYSTYKSVSMLNGLEPLEGTKPHEIMGLSKPAFNAYMDFMKNSNNRYDYMNKYINYIRDLDSLYKNKPDCFKRVFDFLRAVNVSDLPVVYKMITKYKYDLDRLEKYLTDDIYTYQGIENAREGFQILADYVNICDRMNAPVDKYPKSLKLSHDIALKNLKIVISEVEAKEFKETVSKKEYLKLKYKNKDYEVVIPEKAEDVIDEGQKLHHCVGSYVNRVRRGETKICFMREIANPTLPLITLEIRDGKLTQYRGCCNRGPTEKEMKFIREYAKAKEITVT